MDKTTAQPKRMPLECGANIDRSNLFEVFSACVGPAMMAQSAAAEFVVRGRSWNADLRGGTLQFGDDTFPAQFLGSESQTAGSWLWGWENVNDLPDEVVAAAGALRTWGEANGLVALTEAEQPLTAEVNAHTLGMIACGLSAEPVCYYRGPFDGGSILLQFSGLPENVFAPLPMMQVVPLVTQIISQFPVDQRIMLQALLYCNHTDCAWEDNVLVASFDGQEPTRFAFDEEGRISDIHAAALPGEGV